MQRLSKFCSVYEFHVSLIGLCTLITHSELNTLIGSFICRYVGEDKSFGSFERLRIDSIDQM